jgi:hypothetical protein
MRLGMGNLGVKEPYAPIVNAMDPPPPEMGKEVRLVETVFWPPQGKVPSVSSSKPRAAG